MWSANSAIIYKLSLPPATRSLMVCIRTLVSVSVVICLFIYLFFAMLLVGSYFPDQALNLDHGSKVLSPNHWMARELP